MVGSSSRQNSNFRVDIDLPRLVSQANQARDSYDYVEAVELYTRALELSSEAKPLNPLTEYELLSARAACFDFRGNWQAELADLETMTVLAEKMGDIRLLAEAFSRIVVSAGSDLSNAHSYVKRILKLAKETGDEGLEALGLGSMAWVEFFASNHIQAQDHLEQALKTLPEAG